jgi:novel plant SNARE
MLNGTNLLVATNLAVLFVIVLGILFLDADEMTAGQLVDAAKSVQEESKSATSRIKEQLQVTIDVGQATSKTLKDQTDQIGRVDEQLDSLESNLKRADKQIRIFLRRMATDRVILLLVGLVIFGVIGSIVVAVVNARKAGTTVQGPTDVFGTPDTSTINTAVFGQG